MESAASSSSSPNPTLKAVSKALLSFPATASAQNKERQQWRMDNLKWKWTINTRTGHQTLKMLKPSISQVFIPEARMFLIFHRWNIDWSCILLLNSELYCFNVWKDVLYLQRNALPWKYFWSKFKCWQTVPTKVNKGAIFSIRCKMWSFSHFTSCKSLKQ